MKGRFRSVLWRTPSGEKPFLEFDYGWRAALERPSQGPVRHITATRRFPRASVAPPHSIASVAYLLRLPMNQEPIQLTIHTMIAVSRAALKP